LISHGIDINSAVEVFLLTQFLLYCDKFSSGSFSLLADLQHFRSQTLLNFHNPGVTRAFGAGLRPATPASPGSGGFAAAKRAERSVSALLNFSRYYDKFSSAGFLLLDFSRYYDKFSSAGFPLLADFQHFRILTLLNFHNPVPTRAFGAGLRPATPASPGSGGFAAAKRAEREKLSLLDLSREC
jgi:hypothetical protein